MTFQDLDEFFDDTLRLPIQGKTYVIESPDAKTGLFVQGLMSLAADARAGRKVDADDLQALHLDDDEEKDLHRRLLGTAFDEMLDDGVKWHRIRHAGQTAIFWVVRGKETAEEFWNGGGTPKAPTPTDSEGSASEAPADSPASSSSPTETPATDGTGQTSSPTGP